MLPTTSTMIGVSKVKQSHSRLARAGLGADPGFLAVSLQLMYSHKPGGRLPLLPTRPTVTLPAKEIIPLGR